MNIFALDADPTLCAQYHCDSHCSKMLVEYAQLLSTAHHLSHQSVHPSLYKACYINHPSGLWVRESKENYVWLYNMWVALGVEFHYRYRKYHLSPWKLSEPLFVVPSGLPDVGYVSPVRLAMPEPLKSTKCDSLEDSIQAYREYYRSHKAHLHSWKRRPVPDWINFNPQ